MLPLVEINTESFSAVVPNINDMPAMRLVQIQLVQNPEWQYGMMMNLLRENVAPELQDKFDNLSNAEMQKVILQWVDNAAW
jgi:hypothetical protein